MEGMILFSTIVSAISTVAIAFFSYRSYLVSAQMKLIAERSENFSKELKNLNEINTKNTYKVFWAIVFSNVISDKPNRKEQLGFLIKLFGWDYIKKQIDIDADDLNSVINAKCAKYIDQLNAGNKA